MILQQLFMDPTGSHLIISTASGDNYFLNNQSTKVRLLNKFKGLHITSVGWNPFEPTRTTGSILIGTSAGDLYETLIEPSDEFFKREDKFMKLVWSTSNNLAISGILVVTSQDPYFRKIVLTIGGKILYWNGNVSAADNSAGTSAIFTKFFELEKPRMEEFETSQYTCLVTSPQSNDNSEVRFAVLTGVGIAHGVIRGKNEIHESTENILLNLQLFLAADLPISKKLEPVKSVLLTNYHIIVLRGNEIIAASRLNNEIIFKGQVTNTTDEFLLGACSDIKNSTFWIYSSSDIYEIIVTDEDRAVWKILLAKGDYEEALKLARDDQVRDIVYGEYGEALLKENNFQKAAMLLGKSSKSFESIALTFMDKKEYDALRQYLTIKLNGMKKTSLMQRIMLTSWITEIYMEKLNYLDDLVAAKGSFSDSSKESIIEDINLVTKNYQDFILTYKNDLDKNTIYEIIASHSRREELLFYASTINDYGFALSYWIRLERWNEALNILQAINDPEIVYKYSTVLIVNSPEKTVDTWMRMSHLDLKRLIPAILSYNSSHKVSLKENQGIRYLKYCIKTLNNKEAVIHNTILSIYASSGKSNETQLLAFLERQANNPRYDLDFALRIFKKNHCIESCVHVYALMDLYEEAVKLALENNNIELAASISDKPTDNDDLKRGLWLNVAKKVIEIKDTIQEALDFLKRCDVLKMEDLLPLLPDFTSIDEVKEEVCRSLEDYSNLISSIQYDIQESVSVASSLKSEISKFQKRYALVEPGESCSICMYPLLTRKFYVFPCQHAFHTDCITETLLKNGDYKTRKRISELNRSTGKADIRKELERIISEKCVLCSDIKIDALDRPFVTILDKKAADSWQL
ncbi:hypothetical protein NADFUDRAFT_33585 [Nadsonia fulvescens var. elongata DSM 6958]|uniref:RING-type domain-containing protein n=1 Tax=Nadsonia fulvescens var. elongata DSM 6958 TaxID=857566 RepID=A0A1E3PND5_9ASCO|nr:hypothetical protein NADFUDRAFT_33585 [Nadsonia fulvescens var. elongata DSM 6958]